MRARKVLYRQVSRLPAGVILRLDALAVAATAATGRKVSRADIVDAALIAGLEAAEGDVSFATTVGCALVKEGRKAGAVGAVVNLAPRRRARR